MSNVSLNGSLVNTPVLQLGVFWVAGDVWKGVFRASHARTGIPSFSGEFPQYPSYLYNTIHAFRMYHEFMYRIIVNIQWH